MHSTTTGNNRAHQLEMQQATSSRGVQHPPSAPQLTRMEEALQLDKMEQMSEPSKGSWAKLPKRTWQVMIQQVTAKFCPEVNCLS